MNNGKMPIVSHDAEVEVLGAALLDDDCIPLIREIVDSGDFLLPEHREIFCAIVETRNAGIGVDVVTVGYALEQSGKLEFVGGPAKLITLAEKVPHTVHAEYYARIVRENSLRRQHISRLETELALVKSGGPVEGMEPAKDRFHFHTAKEFNQLDLRREYHVPHVLVAGPTPAVSSGAFKTLKTSIAVIDLNLSLASATPFLNHFPVPKPRRVAVMSGESGGFALQSLARRVAASKGLNLNDIDGWHICTDIPSLKSQSDLVNIERFIEKNSIDLLTIDPLYLAMAGASDKAGNLFAMAEFLEPLTRLGERTGCTPLICHHNTRASMKSSTGQPAELADISWSGFAEWAGQWLLLARREKYDPASDGEHRLWLTAGGRDGHSTLVGVDVVEGRSENAHGRRWDVTVVPADETRKEDVVADLERKEVLREEKAAAKIETHRKKILDYLKRHPDGDTEKAIRDGCSINSKAFKAAWETIIDDELVKEVEVPKSNGQSYSGFKLHRDSPGLTPGLSQCPSDTAHSGTTTPIGGCPSPTVCVTDEVPVHSNGKVVPVEATEL